MSNATPTPTPAPEAPPGLPPELVLDGAIATITLRRPTVANRLEIADLALLRTHIDAVNARPEVRVLRLAAQGRHFCSGFNIGQVGAGDAGARFEGLTDALEQARPVTLAALHGGVYGGATDLALACDFRIGVPACEMFVPAARLGLLFYGGGMQRFVQRLGLQTAKRVFLTAGKLTAAEMRACGFLDELLDDAAALMPRVDALSAQLAGLAPLALLGMKKHLNHIARGTLDAQELARDIAAVDASDDLREGAQAWADKRAPVFRGR